MRATTAPTSSVVAASGDRRELEVATGDDPLRALGAEPDGSRRECRERQDHGVGVGLERRALPGGGDARSRSELEGVRLDEIGVVAPGRDASGEAELVDEHGDLPGGLVDELDVANVADLAGAKDRLREPADRGQGRAKVVTGQVDEPGEGVLQ